jgi:hypothetical protein
MGRFDQLHLEHYLHYGQLAERYFGQARGHCATYEFLIKLPPELEFAGRDWLVLNLDAWDPKWKFRGFEKLRREHWLGAIGVAPRMDVLPTLVLGIGVVAAATVLAKRRRDDNDERLRKTLAAAFAEVQRHAFGELRKLLTAGGDVHAGYARMLADRSEAS